MKRKTIAELKQVISWLKETTGKQYTYYPGGSGFYAVYAETSAGPRELASKPLAELLVFLDAYRRGYGAALDDSKET